MDAQDILSIIVALFGTGGVGFTVVKAVKDWRSGKVESEKDYNRRMIREARENDARADMEVANRIRWQEYSSILRRMLLELGLHRDEIPKEPVNEKCPMKGD